MEMSENTMKLEHMMEMSENKMEKWENTMEMSENRMEKLEHRMEKWENRMENRMEKLEHMIPMGDQVIWTWTWILIVILILHSNEQVIEIDFLVSRLNFDQELNELDSQHHILENRVFDCGLVELDSDLFRALLYFLFQNCDFCFCFCFCFCCCCCFCFCFGSFF